MNKPVDLSVLEIGDRFVPYNDRDTKFTVRSKNKFNIRHGRATRDCLNEGSREIQSKSSGLKVIKL